MLPCWRFGVKVAPYPFPYLRASSSFLCAPFHEVNQQGFVHFATRETSTKTCCSAVNCKPSESESVKTKRKASTTSKWSFRFFISSAGEMLTWHPRLSVRNLRSLFLPCSEVENSTGLRTKSRTSSRIPETAKSYSQCSLHLSLYHISKVTSLFDAYICKIHFYTYLHGNHCASDSVSSLEGESTPSMLKVNVVWSLRTDELWVFFDGNVVKWWDIIVNWVNYIK